MVFFMLLVKRLHPAATCPSYGSAGAIGLDLTAHMSRVCRLEPGERELIKTGIAVAIPEGYYGRIAPRSGLALNHGIGVLAGVIDSDYRGEIGVVLVNHSYTPVEIKDGMRIAQLILERADRLPVVVVGDLPDTDRGSNGYGSTGQ